MKPIDNILACTARAYDLAWPRRRFPPDPAPGDERFAADQRVPDCAVHAGCTWRIRADRMEPREPASRVRRGRPAPCDHL